MARNTALLTVAEVATALKVTDETVHRWAREGKIDYIPLPSGTKRFRQSDIDAILDGSTPDPAAASAS